MFLFFDYFIKLVSFYDLLLIECWGCSFDDCELFLVLESINWFGCIFYDWNWRSKCFVCCMFLDFFVFVDWILMVYLFVIDVLWGI